MDGLRKKDHGIADGKNGIKPKAPVNTLKKVFTGVFLWNIRKSEILSFRGS